MATNSQNYQGEISPGEVVTLAVVDGKVEERRYTRPNGEQGFPMDADGEIYRDGRGDGQGRGPDGGGRQNGPRAGAGAYGPDGQLRDGWVRNGDGTLSDPNGRIYGRGRQARRDQRAHVFNTLEALAERVETIETALEASGVILPDPVVDLAVSGPRR